MKKIIILAGIAFLGTSCGDNSETFTVKEEPLNEAVYASGEIMPLEYSFLRPVSSDRILKILVSEGDTIKQGEILAVLGTPSEDRQLEILTNQVILARQNLSPNSARLNELQGKIELAKQKYRQDSLNAERYHELSKGQAVSKREAEQASLQAESSLSEFKNLQLQYRSVKNDLEERLLNAERQLAQFRHSHEGKILSSPLKGVVYNINFEEGELAQPNEPVLMVGFDDKFKLELLVDERDISKVKIGQKVYFETDAFAGEQFEAVIKKIVGVLQKETRSFQVEAEVLSRHRFYPQSSVEANILVRKSEKALVIPADYLLPGDSVDIQNENEVLRKKIITGINDSEWIEVKSGLNKGDVVVK